MRLFLLNALISPYQNKGEPFAVFMSKPLDMDEYVAILRQAVADGLEIRSSLGHESTVAFLRKLVPDELAEHFVFNRESIFFEEGDMGLAFRIANRGQQMKEHTLEELEAFHAQGEVEFHLLSRVHSPELVFDPCTYFSGGECDA